MSSCDGASIARHLLDRTYCEAYCNITRAEQYNDNDARRAVETSAVGQAIAARYGLQAPYEWRSKRVQSVMFNCLGAMKSSIHAEHGFR
jgi:hypothetical protein